MKASFIIITSIMVFLLIMSILFRACTGFAFFLDGERQTKMARLISNYYFNKSDTSIWIKEEQTESYRRVIDGKIDSLAWDVKYIVGFSGKRYFAINTSNGEVTYFPNLNNFFFFRDHGNNYKMVDALAAPVAAKHE